MSSGISSVYWAANLEGEVCNAKTSVELEHAQGEKKKSKSKKHRKKKKKSDKKKEKKKHKTISESEGSTAARSVVKRTSQKNVKTTTHTPVKHPITRPKLVKFDLTAAPSHDEFAFTPAEQHAEPVPQLVSISLTEENESTLGTTPNHEHVSQQRQRRQHGSESPRRSVIHASSPKKSRTIHQPSPISPRQYGNAHMLCTPKFIEPESRPLNLDRIKALAVASPKRSTRTPPTRTSRPKSASYHDAKDLLVIARWRNKLVRSFRRLEKTLGTHNCDVISRAEAIELFYALGWCVREGSDDDMTVYNEPSDEASISEVNRAKLERRSVPGLESISVATQSMNARRVLTPSQISVYVTPSILRSIFDELLDDEETGYVDLQSMCDFVEQGVGELLQTYKRSSTRDADDGSLPQLSIRGLGLAGRFFYTANQRRMIHKQTREFRDRSGNGIVPYWDHTRNAPRNSNNATSSIAVSPDLTDLLVPKPDNEFLKNNAWRAAVDESVDEHRKRLEAQITVECTFQPQINTNSQTRLAGRYWKRRLKRGANTTPNSQKAYTFSNNVSNKLAQRISDTNIERPSNESGNVVHTSKEDSASEPKEKIDTHHWTKRLSHPKVPAAAYFQVRAQSFGPRTNIRKNTTTSDTRTKPSSCLVTNPRAHERHRSALNSHVERLRGGAVDRKEKIFRRENLGVPTEKSWAKSVQAFESRCDESPQFVAPHRARERLGVCNSCVEPNRKPSYGGKVNDEPAMVVNIQFRTGADGFDSEQTWYGSIPVHIGDNPYEVAFRFAVRNALSHAQHDSLEGSLLHVMCGQRLLKSRVRVTQILQTKHMIAKRVQQNMVQCETLRNVQAIMDHQVSSAPKLDVERMDQEEERKEEVKEEEVGVVTLSGELEIEVTDKLVGAEAERVSRWAEWWKTYRARSGEIEKVTEQVDARAAGAGWGHVADAARKGMLRKSEKLGIKFGNDEKETGFVGEMRGSTCYGEEDEEKKASVSSNAWRGLFDGIQHRT